MQISKKIQKYDTLSLKSKSEGKWFELVLANVLGATIVALGMFMPVLSLALAFIAFSYMQVGVYGFVLKTYQEQNPEFESVFISFKTIIKTLCLKIIVMAGIVIWGLLLIVPGVIFGLNYSFAALILAENPSLSCKQILLQAKQLTTGKKFEIFVMALAMLALVCLGASAGVGVYLIINIFAKVPAVVAAILILIPTILMLFIVALPLFELYLAALYENAKLATQQKPAKQNKYAKKVSKS